MKTSSAIVLFDGVCNFCNRSIQLIIRNDKQGYFRFAPLQSDFASQITGMVPGEIPDSIVLVENNKTYVKSTAALRIARKMDGLWPVFYYLGIWVPAFLRDPVYNLIANNRYRWFGKKESCMIPTPEIRNRFIQTE